MMMLHDQRVERQTQMELFHKNMERQELERKEAADERKKYHDTLTDLLTRAPRHAPPAHLSSNRPSVRLDDPFQKYLRSFFSVDRPFKKITVAALMHSYKTYADQNNLPPIDTRRKLLLAVNKYSVRLQPIKTDGRNVGWSWN